MITAATRPATKRDADYIFRELTRSISPECKAVIDAQIIIRNGKVYMRKRCPAHGMFQPVTHVGRHIPFDPMARVTIPGIIHGIVDQTAGRFVTDDFVPVPCCFPTGQVNSTCLWTATALRRCPACWTLTAIWTTSPTAPCRKRLMPPTFRPPWRAMVGVRSGGHRPDRRPV